MNAAIDLVSFEYCSIGFRQNLTPSLLLLGWHLHRPAVDWQRPISLRNLRHRPVRKPVFDKVDELDVRLDDGWIVAALIGMLGKTGSGETMDVTTSWRGLTHLLGSHPASVVDEVLLLRLKAVLLHQLCWFLSLSSASSQFSCCYSPVFIYRQASYKINGSCCLGLRGHLTFWHWHSETDSSWRANLYRLL